MNNKTKISVITCTYNSEETLEQNLTTVWDGAQPFEQIIVDANSSDKTIEIVNEYKKKGNNIKIFLREPKGISDAMNFGIQNATGNIVQILHSDDFNIDKEVYRKVTELFQTNNITWLYGLTKTINEKQQFVGEQPPKIFRKYRYWLLPFTNYIPHPSVFMSKSLFNQYNGYDTNLKIIMDWDFWLAIGKQHTPAVVIEPWCAFRVHDKGLSTQEVQSPRIHFEEKVILKKNFRFPFTYIYYWSHRILYILRYLKNIKLYKTAGS